MKILTYRIRILGKVQGVFYRASTKEKAISLGLKGWVRNEPNGSVSIVAQGEEKQIQSLIEWCRSGPPRAVVKDVKFNKLLEEHQYKTFTIER